MTTWRGEPLHWKKREAALRQIDAFVPELELGEADQLQPPDAPAEQARRYSQDLKAGATFHSRTALELAPA